MNIRTYSEYFVIKILKLNSQILHLLYEITIVILGSILLALSSKISFQLPFTYVPVTMQTFAVLFLSTVFGRKAVYMVVMYMLEGIIGLPVFAKGGGLIYLFGPTGGYIFGFLIASYVCGLLSEYGFSKSFIKTFFVMIIGNLLIYLFGIIGLSFYTNFDFSNAMMVGVIPFILGDIVKIFILTFILPIGWKLIK